ncbi:MULTISPECIES: DUF4278 domain-containing protein [Nostoc]|uniref:DUF4278 domain-containing protein n=1 Tax=Nostoc paludosum FACHB-159 TaxID=2692908 RepID=A0ABR8K4G6_9NOSO|nr:MULTISPECIES: DUF4278 domain-containing protein [Nostoc]MBD2678097.1 DUF4278 domain-containing protein [Nostoc sp. FACHB-857]MBD2734357.1 DUF4278 domain-containing protein [Nostoc paludosum FACHB-159]
MKLYYRGLSYQYNPSQEPKQPFQPAPQSKIAYDLMFRGVTYRIDRNAQSTEIPLSQPANKLIYRGLTFFINRTTQSEGTVVSQTVGTLKVETAVL